jgi:hypothetical protein
VAAGIATVAAHIVAVIAIFYAFGLLAIAAVGLAKVGAVDAAA